LATELQPFVIYLIVFSLFINHVQFCHFSLLVADSEIWLASYSKGFDEKK